MNIDNDIYRKWLNAETDDERAELEQAAAMRNGLKEAFEFLGRPAYPVQPVVSSEDIEF